MMKAEKVDIASIMKLPAEVRALLEAAPSVIVPESRTELIDLALGGAESNEFTVSYDTDEGKSCVEATVLRCRNGVAVNYTEPYMRRRDPECMLIADEEPTDKTLYSQRFKGPFGPLRDEIRTWLCKQDLLVLPFVAGANELGYPALMIGPRNAGFFATALADLQGMVPRSKLDANFEPRAIIYLAPTFRHTHCDGRQIVVHNRTNGIHEIYSLNLYPGPSAKKGVYGVLLTIGETEGWITAHGSTVQVVTPYDNILTITHEGASGGGKSEMLEYAHRQADGRLHIGTNVVTGETQTITLPRGCELRPVTDDMALCHPKLQAGHDKLVVADAEAGWFVRVNHINHYGTDPQFERLVVEPPEPLLFLNVHAVSKATCLIWEHIEDAPGKPCPNPRVIVPRRIIPGIVNGPVAVDVRSFGVRTPPCSTAKPNYGILGWFHVLPPALAWLWRLVAPRGHDNPSIVGSEALSSEGVGSYWPFATGRRVDQANLLLRQIIATPRTRYVLIPNQHVGSWRVGFMPQWITREYLARRGATWFRPDQLTSARCPLLGSLLSSMLVEGTQIPAWLLHVDQQPEVGVEAYDKGAEILFDFFKRELAKFYSEADLEPKGKAIIDCCLQSGSVADYDALLKDG